MIATYTRMEMLRLLRNKRSFIFSLIFPLALFLVIGGSKKDGDDRERSRCRSASSPSTWSAWPATGR